MLLMIVAEWIYNLKYYMSDGLGILLMVAVLVWAIWNHQQTRR